MEVEALASLTQFGVAGLVGCMWIVERRAAAERERQLEQTHARLMQERTQLGVLMEALRENTRALTALEQGQRGVLGVLRWLADERAGGAAVDRAGAGSDERAERAAGR